MDNFNLKKYLAESKLLKEEETYDIYGDGDVVIDISRATPEQERLIRWESDPENGITEFENSEDAQKFADEIMNLNSAKEVKNYYDNVRGWATVDYLSTSNALNAFVGNKQLNENAPGYDTRKFGEALPTLESVKAAHEAKEDDIKENEDNSYYIDQIKRDLEELDDKEANEYLEDLSKAILKLKMDDDADEDAMGSIMMDAPDRY